MTFQDLFPEASNQQSQLTDDHFYPLTIEGKTVYLPLSSLSKRELFLLKALTGPSQMEQSVSQSAWYAYLVEKQGEQPQPSTSLQFLYLHHQYQLPDDLSSLFRELFPSLLDQFRVTSNLTVLVFSQETNLPLKQTLTEILPTLEADFGLKLKVLLGKVWTSLTSKQLQACFQAERHLFEDYLSGQVQDGVLHFTDLYLWALATQLDLGVIKQQLLSWIDETKDMEKLVSALWAEQGNLAKTAKKLYLHRNSLQYKLEKFHQLSGLNLKQLDDLTLCHFLLLMRG